MKKLYPNLTVVRLGSKTDRIPRLFVQADENIFTDLEGEEGNIRLSSLLDKELQYFVDKMYALKGTTPGRDKLDENS